MYIFTYIFKQYIALFYPIIYLEWDRMRKHGIVMRVPAKKKLVQ